MDIKISILNEKHTICVYGSQENDHGAVTCMMRWVGDGFPSKCWHKSAPVAITLKLAFPSLESGFTVVT